jgi:hypothetical protein
MSHEDSLPNKKKENMIIIHLPSISNFRVYQESSCT